MTKRWKWTVIAALLVTGASILPARGAAASVANADAHMPVPSGHDIFYFSLDGHADGSLDGTWTDSVNVKVA